MLPLLLIVFGAFALFGVFLLLLRKQHGRKPTQKSQQCSFCETVIDPADTVKREGAHGRTIWVCKPYAREVAAEYDT
jgi:hypothetical protein